MLEEYFEIIYNKINEFLNMNSTEKNILKTINNIELKNIPNEETKNKILMNLAGIKLEETNTNSCYYEQNGDNYIKKLKPIFFNIYIYFHSNFQGDKFNEGLSHISNIISFLHANHSFTTKNTIEILEKNLSEFNVTIEKDNIELYKTLQIPYMPSILIKLGLIPIYGTYSQTNAIPGIKSFEN